jgi:3-phosphoshikimate 1-carboxyvinyltransferase
MTLSLMKNFGAKVEFEANIICIQPGAYHANFDAFTIESDWTAASYWFAFAALSKDCEINLLGLEKGSLQGDSINSDLFMIYGVKSKFEKNQVVLSKFKSSGFLHIYDFVDQPDLVQTFAFLNAALGLPLQVNNASNLVLKETDRIAAIAQEVQKLGAMMIINSYDDFYLEKNLPQLKENTVFKTYQDHRMAMAESILAMVFNRITIENEHVVSKSYPDFWKHLSDAGFEINYP